jgi:hypothetical protein
MSNADPQSAPRENDGEERGHAEREECPKGHAQRLQREARRLEQSMGIPLLVQHDVQQTAGPL